MRRTLVLFLLVSTIPVTVMAQLPEVGRIAIYADSMRTTSNIEELLPYTTFDFYIYCQSSENGMKCAEFALGSSTGSMVIVNTEWHDGISVKLGDLASGVSVCYHTCRPGWVSLVKVTLLNTIEGPSSIDIVRHPLVGSYQFANCQPDAAIEAVFNGPGLCINSVCPPDTVSPAITRIVMEDATHYIVHFSEEIFEPDAENLDNILLYTTDGSLDTIPVYFARLQGEGDRVWMALESGLSGRPYKLEIVGLRDVTGNACAPGAGFEFSTDDIGPPELVSAHAPDESRVMLVFSEQLNEISAEEISNYTLGCDGCAVVPGVASAVLEPDGITVRLGLDPPMGEFAEFEITVVGVSDASGNTISFPVSARFWPPDVFPPKITEVSVAADTALAVIWDEPIDPVSAEDPANYSFVKDGPPEEQMDLISAELVDSISLRLNFATAMEVYQEYTLFVSGVMDTSMNVMLPDIISMEPPDTIPPVLISVVCTGRRIVDLAFDEPINTAMTSSSEFWPVFPADYYEPRNIVQITLNNDNTVVRLELANDLTVGAEYTACGIDIRDLSGNSIHMQCLDFICFDNSPPEIEEIFLPDLTHVNIRFDKTVNDAAAETASYVLHEEADSTAIVAIDSVTLYDGDTRAVLTTAGPLDLGEIYTLKMNGIGDLLGNMVDPDRSWSFAAYEIVDPVLLGVTSSGDSIVYLEFDEPLDPVTAEDVSRYSVAEEGDSSIKLPLLSASLDSTGTTAALEIGGPVKTGTPYVVRILGVTDFSGNALYTVSGPFQFLDIYPPELLSAGGVSVRQVRVDFNEAVTTATVEDVQNYRLYPASDPESEITISLASGRPDGLTADLFLSADLVHDTEYSIETSGITDLAGNMMVPDTAGFIFSDIFPPSILAVSCDSIIHLVFSEPLDPATAEDIMKYAVVEAGDTSVRLTLLSASLDPAGTTVDLEVDGQATIGIPYVVIVNGVTDIPGNPLITVSDEFLFMDYDPPRLLSAYAVSERHVIVDFSEAVTSATVEDVQNYWFYPAGEPASEIAITEASRRPDEMTADLLLSADLILGNGYSIEVSGIIDLSGNTMEPDTADFRFTDVTPPAIQDLFMQTDKRLSITFSEPVDSVTATVIDNYSLYFSGNPFPVDSISWWGDEIVLHLMVTPSWGYFTGTVIITGVEDMLGHACSGLTGTFEYDPSLVNTTITLYADDGRHSREVKTALHDPFQIYVWIKPGDYGAIGAEYALCRQQWYEPIPPETFILSGVSLNPAYEATAVGDPISGHTVFLTECVEEWFWLTRIDCICTDPNQQEIIYVTDYTDMYSFYPFVMSCLTGYPPESVSKSYPIIINVQYVGTQLDRWEVSFGGGGIELNWSILETEETPEFEVSRTLDGSESWQPLDAELIRGEGLEYTMIDSRLEFGLSYRYRVECIEDDGRKVLFETDAIATPVMPLVLHQNSPNPFNPSTSISFYLSQSGHVRLEIFDVNGRLVDVLADAQYASGEHSIDWDGRDRGGSSVSSGVYFYRLIAGKESLSRKMVLMR